MAHLAVPKTHKEALAFVASLPDEDLRSLIKRFETLPPTLSRKVLIGSIREAIPRVTDDQAENFLSAIISAQATAERNNLSTEEMVRLLTAAPGMDIPDEHIFSERLNALMSVSALQTLSKAIDVLTEHEHIVHEARILTDVRPVFTDDPTEPPQVAVISHVLRLQYHDSDGQLRSFHVALDSVDLAKLKQVVERAEVKAESLHKFLSLVPMPLLELEED